MGSGENSTGFPFCALGSTHYYKRNCDSLTPGNKVRMNCGFIFADTGNKEKPGHLFKCNVTLHMCLCLTEISDALQ